MEFFQNWINEGEPVVYWLSGFYFTQSFITGVLQNYSRKNRYQIDLIMVKFEVTKFEVETDGIPEIGAFIRVSKYKYLYIFQIEYLQEKMYIINTYMPTHNKHCNV